MIFYLGAKRENRETAREVIRHLEEAGHTCSHNWAIEDNYIEGFHRPAMAAELCKLGVTLNQAVIFLLPGAPGTNIELGYAMALHKPILLIDLATGGDLFEPDQGNIFYMTHGIQRIVLNGEGEPAMRAALHALDFFDRVSHQIAREYRELKQAEAAGISPDCTCAGAKTGVAACRRGKNER